MSKNIRPETSDDKVKYRKATESNVSKANKKSKHKHQYEECLIQYKLPFGVKDKVHTGLQSYCITCGKLGNRFNEDKSIVTDYRTKIDSPIGICWKLISDEELYENYHDKLPVFFVGDIFNEKYVDLEQLMLCDEFDGE